MGDFLRLLQQLDYTGLVEGLKIYAIYFSISETYRAYCLHREYQPKNISQVILPPEITKTALKIDETSISTNLFQEEIENFVRVMTKNFERQDLENLFCNLRSLTVQAKEIAYQNPLLAVKIIGSYSPKGNKLIVDRDNDTKHKIYHELLHMASSRINEFNGIMFSGFCQYSVIKGNDFKVGAGFNEGYTELLNQRYFIPDNIIDSDHFSFEYNYFIYIAGRLELVIGKSKMESLYLNANLKGLINELNQYATEEEIMKFLSNIDFLLKHIYYKNIFLMERNIINICLKYIERFIIMCYLKKLKSQIVNGVIDLNEFSNLLKDFLSNTYTKITICDRSFQLLTENELEKIVTSFGSFSIEEKFGTPKK